ncbi:NADP-dependent oxidoreductase [Herbiconiux sp. L3-i23]|uniref:NADP-dependent oxidoreductase n=1 Tax=Herbiconiux sp. L3-i23 TaxID=2905871 RepID=UPI00205CF09B|nr:NADP-dependent oxidoreductase [Herbiconiux sp. L3-i23]BDI23645.1 NADPH:quinone reductase [Herbiconiux sp. L3-i23]
MSTAVRFSAYGGPDVLELVQVDDPAPGPGEVKVAVVAAGANPGEIGIREGAMAELYPARFPEGQGSDFAGLVAAVGSDVTGFSAGDEVIGFSDGRNAQAEFVTVAADRLIAKPEGLDWHTAGSLYVVGTTAWACVDAVDAKEGDTVVVAGAAGGVGVLATQLAIGRGATVIAAASEARHDYLRGLGAVPVVYGDGLADRIRRAAPRGVDAMIDAHGGGYVDLAVELGVATSRINTIIDFDAAERTGASTKGQDSVEPAPVLRELARLLASRQVELPVYASFPLERVRDAYEQVAKGHGLGKVVIDIRPLAPRRVA